MNALITRCVRFGSRTDGNAVPLYVQALRMSKHAWSIACRILNIINLRTSRRVHTQQMADPLGNLVICARSVTTDAETANDLGASVCVDRQPASEEDQPASDLTIPSRSAPGSGQKYRIERIRLAETP